MSKRRKDRRPAIAHSEPGIAIPAFELRYTSDAAADIKHLDGSIRKQLRKVLEKKLAIDPEGYGLPLRGALMNYWKHEFGNHRIVYRIYPAQRVVAVCASGDSETWRRRRHLPAVGIGREDGAACGAVGCGD